MDKVSPLFSTVNSSQTEMLKVRVTIETGLRVFGFFQQINAGRKCVRFDRVHVAGVR